MSKLQLSHILGSSTSRVQQLAFAQDCLLYLSGSFIIFYNPIVDEQIAYLKHTSPLISCIAISPCEKLLAVCSVPYSEKQKTLQNISRKVNNIVIYKLGEVGINAPIISIALRGHKFAIDHVVFSPDSNYLVTVCNKDGSMFVWDCNTGDRLTQNKNSKSINCLKFLCDNKSVSLVTTGRGNCKIWSFYTPQSGNIVHRIKEEQYWILVGKTIPFNKKFATKQFIDACFWQSYILLLTVDGLLCMIARTETQQKLEKCIDLMIAKTASMDLFQNTVMCAGDNALVKVIDLDTLTLVKKFPKPPPISKQNISKDQEEEQIFNTYEESEEFPQCTGIKTIGSNKFSQFIVTLYSNLTMFIWRPEPQDIIAMRSVITHRASIKSVKILEEFKDDLTFFSTISEDNTLRIWHIYKKCIYNRESIDIAQLIGIKRNAYCRNLTRIIYMQSQKQVTCIAGFCKKSIACIASKEFIMYSLSNFEVVCHEVLDCDAVALEIKDGVAYIGLSNGKVVMYQILQQQDRLNKIRQVQFQNKIKYMEIVADQKSKSFETILMIQTGDSDEVILYSLKKSKVIHVEKGVKCCSSAGHHIVMCKSDQTINIYNIAKGKSMPLVSLKHELESQEWITNVSCNLLWIVVTTTTNKLIVTNFSSAIICTEKFYQNINDLALSDSGEVIMVGDYGDILIYRLQGSHGYTGMEEQVKKWMQKNDLSWMEGSVWARKKSNIEGDRQLSGSVVDSIRLRGSIGNSVRGSVNELPNIEIKYKSHRNDESVFNPNDILKQAKQIYHQIDGIQRKVNANNAINIEEKKPETLKASNKAMQDDDELEEIIMSRNSNKKKPLTLISQDQPGIKSNNSKKRIFGLSLTSQNKGQNQTNNQKIEQNCEQGLPQQYRNNLVHSIIHDPSQNNPKAQSMHKQVKQREKLTQSNYKNSNYEGKGSRVGENEVKNFSQFPQEKKNQNLKVNQNIREVGEVTRQFEKSILGEVQKQNQLISSFEEKLSNQRFILNHHDQLHNIYQLLNTALNDRKNSKYSRNGSVVDKERVMNQFEKLSQSFLTFLKNEK